MATAHSIVPLVPRPTSPFVTPQPPLHHLPLVQLPPNPAHLSHPPTSRQPPSQLLHQTSPAVISTVISAAASTANFCRSAATQVAVEPIQVPSTRKESNNVLSSLSHLSPSSPCLHPQPGSRAYEPP